MDNCIYHKISGSKIYFLILYMDDVLLATNDMRTLHKVKQFLLKNFDMKDMCKTREIPISGKRAKS